MWTKGIIELSYGLSVLCLFPSWLWFSKMVMSPSMTFRRFNTLHFVGVICITRNHSLLSIQAKEHTFQYMCLVISKAAFFCLWFVGGSAWVLQTWPAIEEWTLCKWQYGYCSQQNVYNLWNGVPFSWRIQKRYQKASCYGICFFHKLAQLCIMQ